MNHTNTLLRVPEIFCVLKNKLHQMFSVKKLSQNNISQIQSFFRTVILMWIIFLNCHALKFSIGKLSSYGKTEKFCTIKFFRNNEKIYRFLILAIRKVLVCGK